MVFASGRVFNLCHLFNLFVNASLSHFLEHFSSPLMYHTFHEPLIRFVVLIIQPIESNLSIYLWRWREWWQWKKWWWWWWWWWWRWYVVLENVECACFPAKVHSTSRFGWSHVANTAKIHTLIRLFLKINWLIFLYSLTDLVTTLLRWATVIIHLSFYQPINCSIINICNAVSFLVCQLCVTLSFSDFTIYKPLLLI